MLVLIPLPIVGSLQAQNSKHSDPGRPRPETIGLGYIVGNSSLCMDQRKKEPEPTTIAGSVTKMSNSIL